MHQDEQVWVSRICEQRRDQATSRRVALGDLARSAENEHGESV